MIGIIDYGSGNLRNVMSAVNRLGCEAVISSDISALRDSSALILPGVGAFGDSVNMLNSSGLRRFVDDWASKDKLILGICVGMQMLFERSYEFGIHEGLGYLKGEVLAFDPSKVKVPHMGWNELVLRGEAPITKNVHNGEYVYFVHSYYARAREEDLAAYADYSVRVAAIVRKGNIYGTQFHPEKSSSTGAKILKNYLEMAR